MSRAKGIGALKRNRDSAKSSLQKTLDAANELLDDPKDENDSPRIGELKKRRSLLKSNKESYKTLYEQVLDSLEQEALAAQKTQDEIDTLISEEEENHLGIIREADETILSLEVLQEEFENSLKRQRNKEEIQMRLQTEKETELQRLQDLKEVELKRLEDLKDQELQRLQKEQKESDRRFDLEQRKLDSQIRADKEEREQKHDREHRKIDLEELSLKNKSDQEDRRLELAAQSGHRVDLNESGSSHTHKAPSVRYPKLEIEKFHGDKLKWPSFISIFKETIGSSELSDREKFSYLQGLVKGPAAKTIQFLPLTEDSYAEALKLLEERYGDEQVIRDSHYAQLHSLSEPADTVAGLREFYDCMEGNLRALESRGVKFDSDGSILTLLRENLPGSVRLKLEELRALANETWSLDLFRTLLRKHLASREAVETVSAAKRKPDKPSGGSGSPNPPYRYQKGGSGPPRATTVQTLSSANGGQSGSQKKKRVCAFCEDDHFSNQCQTFPDLQSRKEKLKGHCFKCLLHGHRADRCKSTQNCWYCKSSEHHQALCPKKFSGKTDDSGSVSSYAGITAKAKSNSLTSSLVDRHKDVRLYTAWTVVRNPGTDQDCVSLRVLLDHASDKTYVSEKVAKALKARPVDQDVLSICKLRQKKKPESFASPVVELEIMLKDHSYMKLYANVISPVVQQIPRHPLDLKKWGKYLPDQKFLADSIPERKEWASVDLLIGGDFYEEIVLEKKTPIGDSGLFLKSSKLGEIVTGAMPKGHKSQEKNSTYFSVAVGAETVDYSVTLLSYVTQEIPALQMFSEPDAALRAMPDLSDWWSLETIGIKESPHVSDDDIALEKFNSTVIHKDGRYWVTFPWRDDSPDLPSNYQLALGRFRSSLKRSLADLDVRMKVDAIVSDQHQREIVEIVDETTPAGPLVHYLAHQIVVTEWKDTTKVRMVLDGSAKGKKADQSLNELLYRGPVGVLNLCGLLLRMRLSLILILSDVEKTFLMGGLQEADRDVTRFFWFKDASKPTLENNLQIYRFCRVPFGAKPSPFLLRVTLTLHLQSVGTPVALKILQNIYVDNVLYGVDSVEEGLEFYKQSKSLFKEGASMNLREFTSNNSELRDQIPEADRAKGERVKVLGLNWDLKTDSLSIPGAENFPVEVMSKRDMLQAVAKIFDPLGLVTPVLLRFKVLIQNLWKRGIGWDDPVPPDVLAEWESLAKDMDLIGTIQIPRFVGQSLEKGKVSYDLFCFTDASKLAFSSVVYLKLTNVKTGLSTVQNIFSKSRLASVKEVTIPRLELMGVLIGARNLDFVFSELDLDVSTFILWTYSQCVMDWLTSSKLQPVFVEKRLREIRQQMDGHQITCRYIPSAENPADLATRGLTVTELIDSDLWWHGPEWLILPMEQWPVQAKPEITVKSITERQVKEDPPMFETAANVCMNSVLGEGQLSAEALGPFSLQAKNFSSLKRLLRITAWCQKYIVKLRELVKMRGTGLKLNLKPELKKISRLVRLDQLGPYLCQDEHLAHCHLSVEDISGARFLWDLHTQEHHFPEVFEACAMKGVSTNLMVQLGLRLDEKGLIRCHGRLQNAELTEGAKCPKLLPRKSDYGMLIVQDCHERVCHSGTPQTLAAIRQNYWIPKGRAVVQQAVRKCLACKRVEGGPYSPPNMPSLPEMRVSKRRPFEFVGLALRIFPLSSMRLGLIFIWLIFMHVFWAKGKPALLCYSYLNEPPHSASYAKNPKNYYFPREFNKTAHFVKGGEMVYKRIQALSKNTQCDYFGPVYVKNKKTQETFKVWVSLFTCLTVRAIHLEVIEDMTAEKFLNCLRRFIARRGKPREFVSDNAGQFTLTEKTLNLFWRYPAEHPNVQSYLSDEGISWRFITELAPWMGGFYERLVGMVKRAMKKSLGRKLTTNDQLLTYLAEIEAVLNSRPLVYVGSELEDRWALTPADLLGGPTNTGTPEFDTTNLQDEDFYLRIRPEEKLFQFWKRSQEQLNQFWKLWRDDYLLSLRERQQRQLKTGKIQSSSSPRIGEVVLIWEDLIPRGSWKMGRILELTPSSDRAVRKATVELPDKSTLRRSIIQLYPLECVSGIEEEAYHQEQEGQDQGAKMMREATAEVTEVGRPSRRAKEDANRKISEMLKDGDLSQDQVEEPVD